MVSFNEFWSRLKDGLSRLPEAEGMHMERIGKWSQQRDYFGEPFLLFYRGGNVIECEIADTNKVRSIGSGEFRKVYGVWQGYRSGEIRRSHIAHELGVQNASWIIPILKAYEHLMR